MIDCSDGPNLDPVPVPRHSMTVRRFRVVEVPEPPQTRDVLVELFARATVLANDLHRFSGDVACRVREIEESGGRFPASLPAARPAG